MEESLSHYRLIRQLGAGAASEVHLAEDRRDGRFVALKVLHPHLTSNRDHVRRFQQEAEWVSMLNHPNIVSIYEVGQDRGRHFMATEYIDGETLRPSILSEIPITQVLRVAIGVVRGLSAAHEQWIVHRDVKPENIMVSENRTIKVVDFGLAKLTRPTGVEVARLTSPGTVIGTLHYLAPEQLLGWGVDPRTDLFSLGVVIYEMLTGFPPFDGPSNQELVHQILRADPPPISGAREGVPESLQRIVMRALAKDADDRYPTAREMLLDLGNVRNELASVT
ncbi:MAG TPA: serine/threonine-protein kinase [Thermoanaerobaculia bacterium]|nr:serine/threonine-protein kinase [Thermoanaerobaculia bacterium]